MSARKSRLSLMSTEQVGKEMCCFLRTFRITLI